MARTLKRLFDRVLRRQDYVVRGETQPRLIKWTLLGTPWVQLYVHKFNGPDWTTDAHDHPSSFISIGLRGSYVETVYDTRGESLYDREWKAPWIRRFPPTHMHRTSAVGPKGAWTFCIAGRYVRNWNFLAGKEMIPWRDYMKRFRVSRMDVRLDPDAVPKENLPAAVNASKETSRLHM